MSKGFVCSARRRWCVALVLLLLPALGGAAVTPPELEISAHRLDNGLEVLLLEDHSAPVVNLQVWYHVGSKNEKQGRSGFAHLFEHIMFKGSANLGPEEHGEYIQSIGGRYNAGTGFDTTIYWQTFPSNYLERILFMEADRLRSLDVSEKNFRSERDVVIEERRVRVDNPPFGRLAEVVLDAIYTTHPYRILPIGSIEDLNAAGLADVRDFHRRYYVPNNATLVIAGDLDEKQTLAWVEEHFGGIPAGEPISREIPQEPQQTGERRVVHYDANTPLPAVIVAYHVPEDGHPDLYALDVAGNILSNGQSSRLYRKMVYEDQIALQAAGEAIALEDPGVFFFFAIMNQGSTAEEGEAALLEAVARLRDEPVSDRELEKAKNQFVSELVFGRQKVQEKAEAVAYAEVVLGAASRVNEQLADFQGVTAGDVRRVVRKYFTEGNRTVVHMLPESMRPAPEPAASREEEGSR